MTVKLTPDLGQVVLVLQGGGALGAYQVGVYQALHEAGIEPDWVIGTSIGAINASIIAGNQPAERMSRLQAFWQSVEHGSFQQALGSVPLWGAMASKWLTMTSGIGSFFKPNPLAFMGTHMPLGADGAGYYSTMPLQATLNELVDFDLVNRNTTRLTVGAANVRTSEMRYFDSRDMPLDARHVMASGALPPAFPAIRIDGELYWDGGILSNTPVEAIFDDYPRRNSLVFAVHIWNPDGAEPETIWQVLNRQKDIQYSSRAVTHIMRQKQLHRLRHVVIRTGEAYAGAIAAGSRGTGSGRLWLPHAHARRAPARADARWRGSHEGYRLQSGRHPCALGSRLRRYAPADRQGAVAGRVRSDRRLHSARSQSRHRDRQQLIRRQERHRHEEAPANCLQRVVLALQRHRPQCNQQLAGDRLGPEPRVDLSAGRRCAVRLRRFAVHRLDVVAEEAQRQRGRRVWRHRRQFSCEEPGGECRPEFWRLTAQPNGGAPEPRTGTLPGGMQCRHLARQLRFPACRLSQAFRSPEAQAPASLAYLTSSADRRKSPPGSWAVAPFKQAERLQQHAALEGSVIWLAQWPAELERCPQPTRRTYLLHVRPHLAERGVVVSYESIRRISSTSRKLRLNTW